MYDGAIIIKINFENDRSIYGILLPWVLFPRVVCLTSIKSSKNKLNVVMVEIR